MGTVSRNTDRLAGLFLNLGIKYLKKDGTVGVQQAGFGHEWRNMPDCTGDGAEAKNAARVRLIKWFEGKCAANGGRYTLTAEDLVQLFEFTVVDMNAYDSECKTERKFLIDEE